MLDRNIGLAGIEPEKAAAIPATGEARIERERTVDQPDCGADVLAEISQHEGGVGKYARVVLCYPERVPSEITGLVAACLRLFGPDLSDKVQVTDRRPGECRPVMPIDRDRLI